jgi:hypothetical protein
VAAVVSMAEWVVFTAAALSAQDIAEVGGEDIAEVGGEDIVAGTFQGTALASGLDFPAIGLITDPDGVILTTVILIIILRRSIQPHRLILTPILATGMCTPHPIRLTARTQMEGRFI